MSCCFEPDDDHQAIEQPPSFLAADWMPLDQVAQTFAEFGAEATSAHALQAVGYAFLALSFEVSAHKHYTLAYHGLWGHVPSTIIQGLDQSLADLDEATTQWSSVVLWFEKLASQEPGQVDRLRFHFDTLIQDHQQHLWNMRLRLRKERDSMGTRLSPAVVPQQREVQP